MIQGLNNNISCNDEIYHVQTQDMGTGNPQVVTMVYKGGAIVFSCSTGYNALLGEPDMEAKVRGLLQRQHTKVSEDLQSGGLQMTDQSSG